MVTVTRSPSLPLPSILMSSISLSPNHFPSQRHFSGSPISSQFFLTFSRDQSSTMALPISSKVLSFSSSRSVISPSMPRLIPTETSNHDDFGVSRFSGMMSKLARPDRKSVV